MKIKFHFVPALFLFILVCPNTTAQENNHVNTRIPSSAVIEENLNALAEGGIYTNTFDNRYEGVKGSPFLSNAWEKGGLLLISGTFYNNIELKLDVYNNNLIYKNEKGEEMMLDKAQIDYFLLITKDGAPRKFKLIHSPDNPLGIYYEVLYDDKSSFLIRHSKQFVKADYQKAYNANRPYDEFKDETNYYLLKANGDEPLKVKLSKKSALDVFENEPWVGSYITEHHLTMKKESDWLEILGYYDSAGR